MTEIVDDLHIINRALARIGSSPIGAIDEETPKTRQCNAVYRDRIDSLIGLYDWSFARKTYALDLLAEAPLNGWTYAFALPGTRLSAPWRVLRDPRRPDDPFRRYALEEDRLYADVKPLWATFGVRVNPQIWPPAFRLAAIVGVAADLCVPIAQDKTLAAELREQFEGSPEQQGRGGLVGQAISRDAAGAQQKAPLWQDPLTAARLA